MKPNVRQTFHYMWGIMDTDHLTHQFNEHDEEVLELVPDIPMDEMSEGYITKMAKYRKKLTGK